MILQQKARRMDYAAGFFIGFIYMSSASIKP